MIPYEIDPSLYTAEPESPVLDDGFSPPRHGDRTATENNPSVPAGADVDPVLRAKSPF
jgi:hypothetical protein